MLSLELRGTPCGEVATCETFLCPSNMPAQARDSDSKALADAGCRQWRAALTAGWQPVYLLQCLARAQDARDRLEQNLRESVLQRCQLCVRIEG